MHRQLTCSKMLRGGIYWFEMNHSCVVVFQHGCPSYPQPRLAYLYFDGFMYFTAYFVVFGSICNAFESYRAHMGNLCSCSYFGMLLSLARWHATYQFILKFSSWSIPQQLSTLSDSRPNADFEPGLGGFSQACYMLPLWSEGCLNKFCTPLSYYKRSIKQKCVCCCTGSQVIY